MTRERLILWSLLAWTFAIRAIHADQAIVENYVGRQIPTAMVARNLERGKGFLHPQLDTGPFPNLFLVEPPIYAQLVAWIKPVIGFDWEPTGRLVSAAATTLAAWGLFGLVRRRDGLLIASLAMASFGMFPVMIRYGRAFQPDALMLGCILAGLRIWDEYEDRGDWRIAVIGGFVLSTGLALKITSAWALIGFVLIVRRWPISARLLASAAMLIPALAWYVLAWEQVARPGSGSLASFDNAKLWLASLSPEAWLRFSTYNHLARGLFYRSFTPIGFVLACWGLIAGGFRPLCRVGLALPTTHDAAGQALPYNSGKVDGLWLGWGIGCALSIVGLASKWHHAYYWMVVAPLMAVGMARGLVSLANLGKSGRLAAMALGSFFLALSWSQSASTWRTPVEWSSLKDAADAIIALTSEDEPVIASEAVIYYSGRPGFRLEIDRPSARRAAGEWEYYLPQPKGPLSLIELYQNLNQMGWGKWGTALGLPRRSTPTRLVFADVGWEDRDAGRHELRAAIRGRPKTRILIDRPDLMIALINPPDYLDPRRLDAPGTNAHAR
jgi:hypothetical protein